MVALGHYAPGLVPAFDVLELDVEDRALNAVEARVPAHLVVVVAAAHAVLAQHPHVLGQFVRISGDHAGVSGGAQVFCGIKAEGGGGAECPRFHSLPLRAPGLGGVFNEGQVMLSSETGKRGPIGALAVKMNRQDGLDRFALRAFQNGLHGVRVQVEGSGVDVGQNRSGAGAEDGAHRGEEAERGGDDGRTGADSGGGQGQPEGIGARGAAQRVGHAQLLLGGALKGGYRLAKDELLRLKHVGDRIQQFLVERTVLALEVQHGHRLGGCGGTPRRGESILHPFILPAAEGAASHGEAAQTGSRVVVAHQSLSEKCYRVEKARESL